MSTPTVLCTGLTPRSKPSIRALNFSYVVALRAARALTFHFLLGIDRVTFVKYAIGSRWEGDLGIWQAIRDNDVII